MVDRNLGSYIVGEEWQVGKRGKGIFEIGRRYVWNEPGYKFGAKIITGDVESEKKKGKRKDILEDDFGYIGCVSDQKVSKYQVRKEFEASYSCTISAVLVEWFRILPLSRIKSILAPFNVCTWFHTTCWSSFKMNLDLTAWASFPTDCKCDISLWETWVSKDRSCRHRR